MKAGDKGGNQLPFKTRFALTNFIIAEYAKSGLPDGDFADYAAEKLKLTGLASSHIRNIRIGMEIPGNVKKGQTAEKARSLALSARVKILEEQMETLLRERLAQVRSPIGQIPPHK